MDLMTELQLTVRFRIHDGQRERFEAIARECMEIARTKDSGTLQYDWFFGPSGDTCVVRERYRDSKAFLEHAANLGGLMTAITKFADAELERFGSPSGELLNALAGLDLDVFGHFQSL